MKKLTLDDVKSILNSPKNVVIVPHTNPDGDAIGSSLGLYHFLTLKEHKVSVIAPNDYPKFLKWVPGTSEVLIFEQEPRRATSLIDKADVVFTLDFNALHRSGSLKQTLEQNDSIKIMIDLRFT